MPQFSNPWLVGAVDAVVVAAAWSLAAFMTGNLGWLNSSAVALSAALAVTVVFWWGYHSVPSFAARRATVLGSAVQGLAWSAFLSLSLWLFSVAFGTTLTLRDLARGHVLAELGSSFITVVGASSFVGASCGIIISWVNLVVVRPNSSIEGTASGGRRPPEAAPHVKR